jgi:Glucose/sorbosone dehydrogenases
VIKAGALVLVVLLPALIGCASDAVNLATANEYGTNPKLVAPSSSALPTLSIAKAVGWPEGRAPMVGTALQDLENPVVVTRFAEGLDHPRWLLVLPNNDVLVAETNKPASKGGFSGIKGWVARAMMRYGGGGGASANRITC